MTESWKIPSNSGWNMTSIRLRSLLKIKRENCLLVEVIFTGRFVDRAKLLRRDHDYYDRQKEYSLILSQLLIKERALKRVYDQLRRWLKTPIRQFSQNPLKVSEELAALEDQQFKLEFDSVSSYNSSQTDHPACRIVYRCDAIAGETQYIVDPSCVQIFVGDLKKYFDSRAPA